MSAVVETPISGLFAKVYRQILAGKAQLPSMPDVALRIRAAMQQPHCNVNTLSKVVQADPGTSAYLLGIANSPLYAPVERIQKVDHAVSRLGMETTRNLVTAYALRAMFTTRSRTLAKIMQTTWHRSARLAALSAVIASRCPGFSTDAAMLGGLLQDIGVLPLLRALENMESKAIKPERVYASVDAFSGKVGPVLLKHWKLDDELVEVTRSRSDWYRNKGDKADLADLVLVARLHTYIGTQAMHSLPRITDLPAFEKLPLPDKDPQTSLAFLYEAEQDVRDVMRMLGV